MDSSFCTLPKEKRSDGLTMSNHENAEEYILEHIIDKWFDHIEFDGMICFECPVGGSRIHSIERIEVQSVGIKCMRNPKTLQNECVMRLELCCVCLVEGRMNCIRRKSWLEIDMRCLKKRFWETMGRRPNIRVRPHIHPICVYASYDGCMHTRLRIDLEFIACQEGRICGLQKTCSNAFCSAALYPQLKCPGN